MQCSLILKKIQILWIFCTYYSVSWNVEFVILFCKQIPFSRLFTIEKQATYHNVVSTNMPWLEAHFRFYRLIVKNKFDVYLLWPFEKKLIFQSVALDFLRVCHRGIKLELLNIKVKKTIVINHCNAEHCLYWIVHLNS